MNRPPSSPNEAPASGTLPAALSFISKQSEFRRNALIVLLVSLPIWMYAIASASVTLRVANGTDMALVTRFIAGRLLLFPLLFATYLLALRIQGRSPNAWRFWGLQILLAAIFLTLMYPMLLLLNYWAFNVAVPMQGNFIAEAFHGNFQDALAPFRLWGLWIATSLELSEIYLLGLALILALNFFLRYRAGQLATAELHAKWLEAQLASLREQIGPHFLFNALNAILGLIDEAPEMAEKMTIELGAMLRHNLNLRDQEFTVVREEIDFTERYLSVMKLRFESRLQVTVDVDPGILDYRMPSFLLLPLVENAIKHGVSRIPGANSLEISGRLTGSKLSFRVANGARGAPEGTMEAEHREIGLDNTRARVATLYGDRGSFTAGFETAGCWVTTVVIPAEPAV